jgi:hypothetical protein
VYNTIEEVLRHCANAQKITGVKVFSSPNYTDEPTDETRRKIWEEAAKI